MANTDQEIAPLIENSHQPQDLKIDIPEEDLEPAPECCIYKVPRRFRVANKKAYTPQLISIGPFHHGNTSLARMERQKLRYYKKFSSRTSKETLERFVRFIKENVRQICRCYDFEFVFQTELEVSNFTKMILYDAVFIIEFFLRNFHREEVDFLSHREWLGVELKTDLMLLENQLPFFVLNDLYNLAFPAPDHETSFLDLACSYFTGHKDIISDRKDIKHLTDLYRRYEVRTRPSNSGGKIDNMYSATMLRAAGVKFKAAKGVKSNAAEDCLLNVEFEKGVLQIPPIHAVHETEIIFRNLMAFEQCHCSDKVYFYNYIQFLDFFVDTDKDVDLLVKKEIFCNGLGSSVAVTNMINNLMVGVTLFSSCYGKIGEELNKHYNNSFHRTKATLKHVYFNNLWRGTATVAAFVVVLLTLIQTILAILERVMPAK